MSSAEGSEGAHVWCDGQMACPGKGVEVFALWKLPLTFGPATRGLCPRPRWNDTLPPSRALNLLPLTCFGQPPLSDSNGQPPLSHLPPHSTSPRSWPPASAASLPAARASPSAAAPLHAPAVRKQRALTKLAVLPLGSAAARTVSRANKPFRLTFLQQE